MHVDGACPQSSIATTPFQDIYNQLLSHSNPLAIRPATSHRILEMNSNSNESPESPAPPSSQPSPLLSETQPTDGPVDMSPPQSGKLFSGDRGLPRSNSIQASQLWPVTTQDGSPSMIHHCMISCPDLNNATRQPWVNVGLRVPIYT